MSIKLKNVVIFLKIEICIHSYLTWGLELGDVAKLLEPIPAWCIYRCLRVFKYGQPSQTLFFSAPDLVSEDCIFKISMNFQLSLFCLKILEGKRKEDAIYSQSHARMLTCLCSPPWIFEEKRHCSHFTLCICYFFLYGWQICLNINTIVSTSSNLFFMF